MYDPNRGYPRIVPYLLYDDVRSAANWLDEVLGLKVVLRFATPDDQVRHAELDAGGFILNLGSKAGRFGETDSITLVFVEDVNATCERALARAGSVLHEPQDQPWGLRQALIEDPQGQRWEISQHIEDVPPQQWGAELLGLMPG
jgi:PhnB protein